jgi:hypothetical protein
MGKIIELAKMVNTTGSRNKYERLLIKEEQRQRCREMADAGPEGGIYKYKERLRKQKEYIQRKNGLI